ncbi:MAG: M28 family peptidase [Balneolales bacterium]
MLFLQLLIPFTSCTLISRESSSADTFSGDSPAAYVSQSFIQKHIKAIADDSMLGRGTGQPGSSKMADYLYSFYTSESFDVMENLEVVKQPFLLEGLFWDTSVFLVYKLINNDTLFTDKSILKKGSDASFFPLMGGHNAVDAPVVFAGYGHTDGPYRNLQLEGNEDALESAWIMVFEEQQRYSSNSSADNSKSISRTNLVHKIISDYGSSGVIFISDHDPEQWEKEAVFMSNQLERPLAIRKDGFFRGAHSSTNVAYSVHPELAARMLGLHDLSQLDSLRTYWSIPETSAAPEITGYRFKNSPLTNHRKFEEHNIISIIPGVDDSLKNEIVILTAHYDHLGLGEPNEHNDIIFNGADDNASGTSVLIQIADAFRQAADEGYRPSRTIVFLHVAAEEWGLIGARHYVANPLFPNNNVTANVNVDMIGSVDIEYSGRKDTSYIYIIGAGLVSSKLEALVNDANKSTVNLKLDELYNDINHPSSLYRRSDHWAFGEIGVPFVFFFSGLHDHYHVPSDTPDRLSWSLISSRAKLITDLVWRLAETKEQLETERELP